MRRRDLIFWSLLAAFALGMFCGILYSEWFLKKAEADILDCITDKDCPWPDPAEMQPPQHKEKTWLI